MVLSPTPHNPSDIKQKDGSIVYRAIRTANNLFVFPQLVAYLPQLSASANSAAQLQQRTPKAILLLYTTAATSPRARRRIERKRLRAAGGQIASRTSPAHYNADSKLASA